MMEIEMPVIEVQESEDRSYAKVVVGPLEKGFGLTVGNCLRRTLLSSLPGAAARGIKFAPELGVKHEFSTIVGVKEDVPESQANRITNNPLSFAKTVLALLQLKTLSSPLTSESQTLTHISAL